ncbi:hypothetical protein [Derxia lacustris]|uniref:hypothetical protein n=1 Tax=Derxia lacustris TaxID=764842 RepID=UPI000A173B06|nr:hypothetical protein [Derxia lacustris]
MQLADAPKEIVQAVANGLAFDDQGNDVRITGTLPPLGQGGKGDDSYTFYRLWDAVFEDCDSGMRFQVFPDGRVLMKNLDPDEEGA